MRNAGTLLICLLIILAGCSGNPEQSDQAAPDVTGEINPAEMTAALEPREIPDLGMEIKLPTTWVSSSPSEPNLRQISFYPDTLPSSELPLELHESAGLTFIIVYPDGFGTELPAGHSEKLTGHTVWSESSLRFQLSNGTTWAYYLVPKSPPASWSKDGFMFIQLPATGFAMSCFDAGSGQEKPMEACDPLLGDSLVRMGEIPKIWQEAGKQMMQSVRWIETHEEEAIRINSPAPNMDIRSPLKIRGEARGFWYFEGDFQVSLIDSRGNELATAIAQAQEEWMTEDFVPFEAGITFSGPDDERGYLIFHKANPSGLPENEKEYRLPVLFPPDRLK